MLQVPIVSVFLLLMGITNANADTNSSKGVGPRNPWIGGQLAYKIAEDREFAERFQPSVRAKIQEWNPTWAKNSGWAFPFFANFPDISSDVGDSLKVQSALENLTTSTEGLYAKFVPNWQYGDPDSYGVNTWVSMGYRLNAFTSGDSVTTYLNQGVFSIGAEGSVGSMVPSGMPLTVALELFTTVFKSETYKEAFGVSKKSFVSCELVAIFPVKEHYGLAFEKVWAEGSLPDVWRLAIILDPRKKGE
jgi:hypothetical protein